MGTKFDDNIEEQLEKRLSCNNFTTCEFLYYDYFMGLSEDELHKLLCILPIGSIIFHSSPAKNITEPDDKYKHFPPEFPVLNNGLTAIKKVLNRENYNKTAFARKDDPDIHNILSEYDRKDSDGKFLGKNICGVIRQLIQM